MTNPPIPHAAPLPAVAPAPGNASDVPEVGTHWRHTGGGFFVVEGFANMETEFPVKYPQTIIYRGVVNGKVWARPLADWARSFTKMDSPAAPVTPDLAGERVKEMVQEYAEALFLNGGRRGRTVDRLEMKMDAAIDALASRPQVSPPGICLANDGQKRDWSAEEAKEEQDAERYRFITSPASDYNFARTPEKKEAIRHMWAVLTNEYRLEKIDADEAIDAAMAKEPKA
jgi:hypothetical protein